MKFMRDTRFSSLLKWVPQLSLETHSKPSISATQNTRFFATQTQVLGKKSNVKRIRISQTARKMAEEAMLNYFYHSRGLHYMVAEGMSKNSPTFIENLLKEVDCFVASEISQCIARHLLYHPVNEFEPFLESSGLKPSEYSHLLPADKMFLNDDTIFMENHHVLCYSGIDPNKIGKIFKEAREVFEYETRVLSSKIEAYKDLGFSRSVLSKLIVCSPSILVGDVNVDLVKVLESLNILGCDLDWVMNNLSEEGSYDWSSVYRVLSLLREICFNEDELCRLIKKHPRLIFEDSGKWTLILVGFETKLGLSRSELCSLFQNFPRSQGLGECVSNLRRCFLFLRDIEMEADEIGMIFRSHSWWFGVNQLKQTSTLRITLKSGKSRLREVVQENPEEMKKWIMGLRVQPLPGTGEDRKWKTDTKWKTMKTQFLTYLGYKENSKEIEIALKSFRGKGSELRERFNFLVSLGFNEEDAKNMVKACPGILAQSSDVLATKFNYLVNEFGYPLSALVDLPICLRYTLQRMKLRFTMYSWLVARGKADPNLAISTVLLYSKKKFMTRMVNLHPDGPKYFKNLIRNYGGGKEESGKVQACEVLGLNRTVRSKRIVLRPSILIGKANVKVAEVVEMLRSMGFGSDWVEQNLVAKKSYDWSLIYRVLSFLRDLCDDENEVREIIRKCPGLIFEDSGEWTLILVGFETKLGSSRSELCSLFLNFPQIKVEKCVSNLKRCFVFLKDIKMEDNEIHKIFRCHSWWLGSCKLKKISTLIDELRSWKGHVRQIVQENPEEMKKWTIKSKIKPLPPIVSEREKTQFLLNLGYKENSKEMELAFRSFRGRGSELQKRFNFFVSLGLEEKDVKDMVKLYPNILNQSTDVIAAKFHYVVKELGYPPSTITTFPIWLKCNLQRVKPRFAMYSWLVARGKAKPKPPFSAIVGYSDEKFTNRFVNCHRDGPKHFEYLKKELLRSQQCK